MKRWLAVLSMLLLLAGCAPHAREPEGLGLVCILGVDGGEEITLTAVCHARGEEPSLRGRVRASDISAARQMLPRCGEREMALTNLSYLIINEEVALEPLLTEVLNDREMSPSVTVWFARDGAALLDACDDPVSRLQVLEEDGGAPTAVEVLAALRQGDAVNLPVLEERDGVLQTEGVWEWTE